MRIPCEVRAVEMERAEDGSVAREGVEAECSECGHSCAVYGTGQASVTRALATLREECPRGERNFYYEDEE